MNIHVAPNGELRFIYHDELQPLLGLGEVKVLRASHVEPDQDGRWVADLSPVGGPNLGPFPLRQQALQAELRWLEQHGY